MVMEEGDYQGLGAPVKLSRTPASLRRLPPRFGEANRAVLSEAGFGEGEIAALIDAGVLLETPQKASAE
jgi:formyl-CoA transferase